MLVAAFGFAIMGALVKVGAEKFTSSELVFYRSLFGLVMIWLTMVYQKRPLKTPVLTKQISRAVVGFTALVLFFYAIAHLPLATAITLNYTSALFLGVLTPIWLHEKPKKLIIFSLILGFIGLSLLLKPSLHQDDWLAASAGLLSGLGAAFAYMYVKQLGKLEEPDWRTVFYFTLISTLLSGVWIFVDEIHAIDWKDLPVLLGLGLSATLAQLALTRAYRTGNTLIVACLAYSTVIFASFFGVLFWQEHLDLQAWFAIFLIVLSGIISTKSSF